MCLISNGIDSPKGPSWGTASDARRTRWSARRKVSRSSVRAAISPGSARGVGRPLRNSDAIYAPSKAGFSSRPLSAGAVVILIKIAADQNSPSARKRSRAPASAARRVGVVITSEMHRRLGRSAAWWACGLRVIDSGPTRHTRACAVGDLAPEAGGICQGRPSLLAALWLGATSIPDSLTHAGASNLRRQSSARPSQLAS